MYSEGFSNILLFGCRFIILKYLIVIHSAARTASTGNELLQLTIYVLFPEMELNIFLHAGVYLKYSTSRAGNLSPEISQPECCYLIGRAKAPEQQKSFLPSFTAHPSPPGRYTYVEPRNVGLARIQFFFSFVDCTILIMLFRYITQRQERSLNFVLCICETNYVSSVGTFY